MSGYMSGLRNQSRIIMALFFREVRTRFGARRLGIFWGVIEPMVHVVGFSILITIFGRIGPYGIPYILFLISGIFPFIMMRNIYRRVVRVVDANRPLLVFPQITVLDMALARVLVEFMTTTTAMITVLFFYSRYVGPVEIENLSGVAVAYGFFAIMGLAMGLFFRPLMALIPRLDMFMSLFMRFLYISSGVIFSLERIPEKYRQYLLWNPFARLLEILRDGFFVRYWPQEGFTAWGYIFLAAAALFVSARVIERRWSHLVGGPSDD